MALVKFRRPWFGPGGVYYKDIGDVPEDQLDQLPTGAEILPEPPAPEPVKRSKKTETL